jgi:hypothetical protein
VFGGSMLAGLVAYMIYVSKINFKVEKWAKAHDHVPVWLVNKNWLRDTNQFLAGSRQRNVIFRHPCPQTWQDPVHLNVSWAPQNFRPEEHKLAKDIRQIIDFRVTVIYNTLWTSKTPNCPLRYPRMIIARRWPILQTAGAVVPNT